MPPQEPPPREAVTIADQPNVPELYVDGVQAVMVANAVLRLNLLRDIAPSNEGIKRRLVVGRTRPAAGACGGAPDMTHRPASDDLTGSARRR